MTSTADIIVDPVDQKQADAEASSTSQTAAPAAESPDAPPELPEKYRDKSPFEIAEMHMNAEKKIGQQANEVGIMRELVSTMGAIKREADLTQTATTEQETPTYDADEFLSKPVETTQQMISDAITQAREETRVATAQNLASTEMARFEADFPEWQTQWQSPEIVEFAQQDASRAEDARRAVQENDIAAARRLMTGFTAQAKKDEPTPPVAPIVAGTESAPTGIEGARAVATESSGNAGGVQTVEIVYEQDQQNLYNTNKDVYESEANQAKLLRAIETGNYRR